MLPALFWRRTVGILGDDTSVFLGDKFPAAMVPERGTTNCFLAEGTLGLDALLSLNPPEKE